MDDPKTSSLSAHESTPFPLLGERGRRAGCNHPSSQQHEVGVPKERTVAVSMPSRLKGTFTWVWC
jgi:hypothetical protein